MASDGYYQRQEQLKELARQKERHEITGEQYRQALKSFDTRRRRETRTVEGRQIVKQIAIEKQPVVEQPKVTELATGQKVILDVKEVTPQEQAAREFKPSESPYRPEYVEPAQRKSYLVPESEKIKVIKIGEKVAGIEDPVAKVSMAVSSKRSEIEALEQSRMRQIEKPLLSMPVVVKPESTIPPKTKYDTSQGQRIAYIDIPIITKSAKTAVGIGGEVSKTVKEDIFPFFKSAGYAALKTYVALGQTQKLLTWDQKGIRITTFEEQYGDIGRLEKDPDVYNLFIGSSIGAAVSAPVIGKVAAPLIQGWQYGTSAASYAKGEISLTRAATQSLAIDIAFKAPEFFFGKVSKPRVVSVVEEVGAERTMFTTSQISDISDIRFTQLGFKRSKGFLEKIGVYQPDAEVLGVYKAKGTQLYEPTLESQFAVKGDVEFGSEWKFKEKDIKYTGLGVADTKGVDTIITYSGKKAEGMAIRTAEISRGKQGLEFETISFGLDYKPKKTKVYELGTRWESEVLPPEQYAEFLAKKGEINYNPKDLELGYTSSFAPTQKLDNGKTYWQTVSIGAFVPESQRLSTIRHELIHYKVNKNIPEIDIASKTYVEKHITPEGKLSYKDYRNIPTEQIALGLQDVPFGFEVQVPKTKVTSKTEKLFSLSEFDITSVGYGRNKDLYVEDIFTSKNVFSKEVTTELGSTFATKQYLTSDSLVAPNFKSKMAEVQAKDIVSNVLEKWNKPEVLATTKPEPIGKGGGRQQLLYKSKTQMFSIPDITTQVVKSKVSELPQITVSKQSDLGLRTLSRGSILSPTKQVGERYTISTTGNKIVIPSTRTNESTFKLPVSVSRGKDIQSIKPKQTIFTLPKPTQQDKSIVKVKPLIDTKPLLDIIPIQRLQPIQDLSPVQDITVKQLQETKQTQETKQIQETKQLIKLGYKIPRIITVQKIIPPKYPRLFTFNQKESESKPSKSKTKYTRLKRRYTPSIQASIFGIRSSKISDKLASTGLVVRPVIK